ncbi:TIGR02594 family protein [Microvirga massiliensis]|uniref:C40 family peptidase n=1 Tax=Microvirga massiliensis TaxID=1033741 RepID=UPI00069C6765|nr:TIGR02594 family protein [Microvirga massiliensis]
MSTPWFIVATSLKGISEVRGAVDNPKIVEMFRISGHPKVQDDETPWCAAFVGACLRLSGYRSSGSLGARSYENFGLDLKGKPQHGCVVVFTRGDPTAHTGHVAFYDRDDDDHIFVLGGNQGNAVTTARFPKSRVITYRMPTETAPLPTNTTLPNILALDPASAPPHVLEAAATSDTDVAEPREPRATEVLAEGAIGPRVRMLQDALTARGFQLGSIDGEFGPRTAAAVSSFQSVQGLPVTGIADNHTLRALGLAVSEPIHPVPVPVPVPQGLLPPVPRGPGADGTGGGAAMQQDILRALFEAFVAKQQTPPVTSGAGQSGTGLDTPQLLQVVLGALAGKSLAPSPESPTGTAPPVLSPIDKLLGGEALAGKKTPLAILAYAVLAILQSVDVAGTATGPTATPTGQILTTLIASFGGLGVLGKIDRVVQMLGIIAAKSPK